MDMSAIQRVFLLVIALTVLDLSSGFAQAALKPNVLLIFTDDQGWADVGFHGVDAHVSTPHIDRLAADGIWFSHGYVTAPQCTPARAGILTGMYQQRIGVECNDYPLTLDVMTLPERLAEVGYVSGMSGKWHLNKDSTLPEKSPKPFNPALGPHAHGFDEYFEGFLHSYRTSHGLSGKPFADAPRTAEIKGCRVEIQTSAALSFLERRAESPEQPWFLYVSYMAPHLPPESPEPWFSRTPKELPVRRRQALALIGAIDDGVGKLREKIRDMGQEEDTLIFFISDNGAPLHKKAWNGSLNSPMRGEKGMLSEGGIRVPFVAAWPGTIPGGRVSDHPVISLDVAATTMALAGLPQDKQIDGVNIMPLLSGDSDEPPHNALYWRWRSQAAIQVYPYKLILLGDRKSLLFDITDPEGEHEQRNLVDSHPDIAAELSDKLETWIDGLPDSDVPRGPDRFHERLYSLHRIAQVEANPLPAR
jgi:uncharacterized sulfatase